MSSFGGNQWKVIRHYLSLSNLNAEVEKLVQRIKPATPEQWESLIKRFEKAMSIKLSQTSIETDQSKTLDQTTYENTLKATTIEETDTKTVIKDKVQKPEEKISQEGLTLGNEMKEITVEGLWRGMKLKKDLYMGKVSDQSWKSNKPAITKTSIHSRTAYVISALVTAETAECMQKRTDDLISHLRSYPECRDYAIKEGAIRALLRLQRKSQDDTPIAREVSGTIKQALALLGYTGPTKGPGPHILAIDGGGIRGLITIEILRHLEKLTGKRVNELFDYIIGVSTGAIIAAVIGSGVGTLDTANEMYRTLSKKMFGNTSFIGGTSRLVFSHAFYDTVEWENLLKSHLKDCTLLNCNKYDVPKMALLSCVVNTGKITPFLFRTYECGFRVRSVHPGTAHAPLWCAVRASAAAPTYFQEFSHEGLLHQDGGIMANNPTAVGLHEAKLLYGADALKNATIISVGNGKPLKSEINQQLMLKGANKGATGTSWKEKFYMILESATNTEAVHQVLNDSLPPGTYYRFNPPLSQECSMTEIDPAKLADMLVDTAAYIRRNQHKFERAAAALCRRRSALQRAADEVRYRAHLMGVTHTK